jgi:hypothetical protein
MSKPLTIVLSIIGGLFLLGIIAVGGAFYWVYQNKGKWIESAERLVEEGKKFGVNNNNEGCLKEALARHKRDKSTMGQIATQTFLNVCLEASKPSPGFCDGVPQQNEILKSASWALKKCSDAGLQNDPGCKTIFGAVQSHCHRSNDSPEK